MSNTLYIYGDIGESFWDDSGITDDKIRKELDSLPRSDSLDVRINSMGGQTHHGVAIFNLLRSFSNKQKALNQSFSLNTIVDGFAYSAASVIMMAGDKRIMNSGSRAMIHNPWSMMMGDYRDAQKAVDYLQKAKQSTAQMYADTTGKELELFNKLMDDETYLLPQEAVDLGLATEVSTITTTNSKKNPYEQNLKLFQELSKQGKGAYVQTMLSAKKSLEKSVVYPIERLTREAILDTLCA